MWCFGSGEGKQESCSGASEEWEKANRRAFGDRTHKPATKTKQL